MARTSKRPTPKRAPPRFWPYGLVLSALLLFLDQYTKYVIRASLAPGMSTKVLPGVWFTSVQNTGATWGLFQDTNTLFVWLSVIAFGLLLFFLDEFKTTVDKIAYTLIMTGLWGNLIDRVSLGHVVDFIDVRWWPVFNLADSCITVAVALFLLERLRTKPDKPKRTPHEA
jgi:signal peptidase II